jgi:hypothetical protein
MRLRGNDLVFTISINPSTHSIVGDTSITRLIGPTEEEQKCYYNVENAQNQVSNSRAFGFLTELFGQFLVLTVFDQDKIAYADYSESNYESLDLSPTYHLEKINTAHLTNDIIDKVKIESDKKGDQEQRVEFWDIFFAPSVKLPLIDPIE